MKSGSNERVNAKTKTKKEEPKRIDSLLSNVKKGC